MRKILAGCLCIVFVVAGCRGEDVPRDYQNQPPAMTNPPDDKSEAPSQNATGTVMPEPTSGAEGTSAPYQPVTPSTTSPATQSAADPKPLPPTAVTTGGATTSTSPRQ